MVFRHPADPAAPGAAELPRLAALLDWELSTLGNPLSDLANFCLPYHSSAFPLYSSFAEVGVAAGVPTERQMLAWYCADSGGRFTMEALEPHWPACVAFSFFRLSVILQGVAFRSCRGVASQADKGAFVGSFAGQAAEAAWDIMNHGFQHDGSPAGGSKL